MRFLSGTEGVKDNDLLINGCNGYNGYKLTILLMLKKLVYAYILRKV